MQSVEGRDAGIVFDMEELDGHAEQGAGRLEDRDLLFWELFGVTL
jgi:hypothetical protein